MPLRPHFCRALDLVLNWATSAHEWRSVLGVDWEWAQPLLRPTGENVESVLIDHQPHRVVVHPGGRIVAISEEGGPPTPLASTDVGVREVDRRRLFDMIGGAIGLDSVRPLRNGEKNPTLGRRPITASTQCAVRFCTCREPWDTEAAIWRLVASATEPIIIVTPRCIDDEDLRYVARRQRCCLLPLEESVVFDGSRAVLTENARRQLETFAAAVRAWEAGESPRDLFRFQRLRRVWLVVFDGKSSYVPHREATGLAYIQHLLARPHSEIPVEHLEKMVSGDLPLHAVLVGEAAVTSEALSKVRAKRADLEREMDRAVRENDDASQNRIRTDLERIDAAIRRTSGLNGRVRRVGDDAERLRTRITHAIRNAIRVLDGEPAPVTAHLKCLKLGRVMSYRPDISIPWEFS